MGVNKISKRNFRTSALFWPKLNIKPINVMSLIGYEFCKNRRSRCVNEILQIFFCTLHPNWVNSLHEIPTKIYLVEVNSGEIGTAETTSHLGI